ncbi:MAG: glycoside hydrolase family 99-like domain-containing protein [Rickettsiales bacterium]|jgi:hypothetical protein|nr:glycoside hydrolase family 99-like domain-containing protein [Rickettsiales bacterium]
MNFHIYRIYKNALKLTANLHLIKWEKYQEVRNKYFALREARDSSVRAKLYNRVDKDKARKEYLDWCLNHINDKSQFVPLSDRNFERKPGDPKVIAYYLPQFYSFPMNDNWFGRGFTEWTNTTKAVPQFCGHYQPRLPIDTGFYNLDTTAVMHRQAELARQYGIYGFCFYYYWFHGDRIMEKPIFNFLSDKSLDMPFMLFWANENWTQNWHPDIASTSIGSKVYDAYHAPGEAAKFLDDILPFFQDPRYIKIDGRPALTVYKHNKYKGVGDFIAALKKECANRGTAEPYIILICDNDKPEDLPTKYNADAFADFATNTRCPIRKEKVDTIVNPNGNIKILKIEDYIKSKKYMYEAEYPIHRGAMTGYDNTARKISTEAHLYPVSPGLYKTWITDLCRWTRQQKDERFVFVSAWNEWAEAMYLEPDMKYGYSFLDATRQAIEDTRK